MRGVNVKRITTEMCVRVIEQTKKGSDDGGKPDTDASPT
jgi:hypothetical protein